MDMIFFFDPKCINALFPVLYIDPGTGSMLFAMLIGLIGTAGYLLRNLFVKLHFRISGGKAKIIDSETVPYAVFSDSKHYWNTFESICDEFERRGEPLTYMTASPDDPALQKEYSHVNCIFIGEGNRAFARLNLLKADILLSTTPGLDVYQWKRSKDVKWYVHVLHMPTDPSNYRMFGLDYYDAVLVSGEYQLEEIRKLEKLRNLPEKEIKLVGLPYMDALERKKRERIQSECSRTILVAPSWGTSSLLNRFGSEFIRVLLTTGYHIVIRPHPQSYISEKDLIGKLMYEFSGIDNIEWNNDNDNFDVLQRADIMISDFSGVMFDFALVFQKPVIYVDTRFDKSPYDAWWLDDEMWKFKILPKLGKQLTEDNLPELKSMIDEMLHENQYQDGIQEAKKECWTNIGRSASLVTDYLISKRAELQIDNFTER